MREVFDPWLLTVAESLELPIDLDDPRSSLWQYVVAQELMSQRQEIEGGSSLDLLSAIARCARHGLAVPPWMAAPFVAGVDAVRHMRADSWDVAFGAPWYGRHFDSLRLRRHMVFRVAALVVADVAKHPRDSLGLALDRIAKALDFDDEKKVARLYEQAVKQWPQLRHREIRKRFGLVAHPKKRMPIPGFRKRR